MFPFVLHHSNNFQQAETLTSKRNNTETPKANSTNVVTVTGDCNIMYSTVSDNNSFVENITSECKEIEHDHTYNAAEFNNKADPKKELQYNTLQREGAANILQ